MKNNNKILEELSEVCPSLKEYSNNNPYSVSFSYFNNLPEAIMGKIKSGIEGEYYFTKKNPYSIPTEYFENLSGVIFWKLENKAADNEMVKEMEEISPLLNTISRKDIYTVPDNYFSTSRWSSEATIEEKAKVLPFTQGKRLIRYAVAAVIMGLLAVGMFLFTGKQETGLQAENKKAVSEVKKLSEQEIVDFLKTTPLSGSIVTNNDNNSAKKDNDIRSVVSQMSDKEIQGFLEENGDQDEM